MSPGAQELHKLYGIQGSQLPAPLFSPSVCVISPLTLSAFSEKINLKYTQFGLLNILVSLSGTGSSWLCLVHHLVPPSDNHSCSFIFVHLPSIFLACFIKHIFLGGYARLRVLGEYYTIPIQKDRTHWLNMRVFSPIMSLITLNIIKLVSIWHCGEQTYCHLNLDCLNWKWDWTSFKMFLDHVCCGLFISSINFGTTGVYFFHWFVSSFSL